MTPQTTTTFDDTDLPPGIGKPAFRALTGAGYTRLEQLTRAREADLLALYGVGHEGAPRVEGCACQSWKVVRTGLTPRRGERGGTIEPEARAEGMGSMKPVLTHAAG